MTEINWFLNILRWLCAALDYVVYTLITVLFRAIFNLANFELPGFYESLEERVYVILGIFMLFKVTISMITYLVNPDKITDKEQGAAKVVTRILTVLVMLIGLPTFFNLMTEAQNKILPVIPRVIVGTANTLGGEDAWNVANNMSVTMLQGFAHLKDDESVYGFKCDGHRIEDPGDLLKYINEPCSATNDKIYAYDYFPIVSTLVGALACYVLFSLAISVAIRAFKLIILRMMAPIPIISYIDPKSAKDGAFSHWTKTFISTWAELFINIGIIYFIVYIIDFLLSGQAWKGFFDNISGPLAVLDGAILLAFLVIGLLMFAKQAPQFVMDSLGIKNKGGFMKMLSLGAAAIGGIGAASSAFRARQSYDAENRPGENHGLRNLGASLFSGLGSVSAGGNAVLTSDKPNLMTGFDAQAKSNATMLSRINAGSTLGGRLGSMAEMLIAGETIADRNERTIKGMEDFNSALDAIGKRTSGEMVKSDVTTGALGIGNYSANYKSFKAAMEAAAAQGLQDVEFLDTNSNTRVSVSLEDAQRQIGYLLKNNENNYIQQVQSGSISDIVLTQQITDAEKKATKITRTGDPDLDAAVFGGLDSNGVDHGTGFYNADGQFEISGRDSVKKTQDVISVNVTEAKRENQKHVANRRGQGNK